MTARGIVEALRNTESRSKQELLTAAADTIDALLEDLKTLVDKAEPCDLCVNRHITCKTEEFDCDNCPDPCPCHDCCTGGDGWEWRGIQKGAVDE